MILSAELDELLIEYSNQIDKEHIEFRIINELRICNYVNQPFIRVKYLFCTQYLLTPKIFNLYKSIFKLECLEN